MCIFTYPSESINQLSVNSYSKYVNHQYCRPKCKTEGTFNVSMYVKVTIIVHVNSTTWRSGRWFSPFMFVKFVLWFLLIKNLSIQRQHNSTKKNNARSKSYIHSIIVSQIISDIYQLNNTFDRSFQLKQNERHFTRSRRFLPCQFKTTTEKYNYFNYEFTCVLGILLYIKTQYFTLIKYRQGFVYKKYNGQV